MAPASLIALRRSRKNSRTTRGTTETRSGRADSGRGSTVEPQVRRPLHEERRAMAFLFTYGKKLVEKMIRQQFSRMSTEKPHFGICASCGRRIFRNDLNDGMCNVCWAAEKRRESRQSNERVKPTDSTDDLQKAYLTLNCSITDSDDQIKRRYRILVKECHVDSLPKELPDYLVQAANQKFRQVQESYETIMNSRNKSRRFDL